MNKILIIFLFFLFINPVLAAGLGPASKYQVTMKKIELCTGYPDANVNDVTCTGSVVVADNTLAMDIASASVGASVATYADTGGLPIGTTFTHIKMTLNKDFVMSGYAGSDDSGDSTTCWCRSATASEAPTNMEYMSRKKGVCESTEALALANQTELTMYVASKATVRICQSDGCSESDQTEDVGNSIEDDGVDQTLFGLAFDAGTTNATTELSIIYELSSPYTVGITIPKIQMSFGTATAFMSYEYADDACYVAPYYPKVITTITD